MIRFCCLIGYVLLLWGCDSSTPQSSEYAYESESVDPNTGVTIRTSIDRVDIAPADRVHVQIELMWDSLFSISLMDSSWEQFGWTVVDTQVDPVGYSEGVFREVHYVTLEPFLAGEYAIPSSTVRIESNETGQSFELASAATTIITKSVLDSEDSGDLDPLMRFHSPSQSTITESANPVFIVTLLGTIMLAVVIYIVFKRTDTATNPAPSPYELLEHIARIDSMSSIDAYETLHHALIHLDHRLQMTSEIQSFIQQCERARFAQSVPSSTASTSEMTPQQIAVHTLELLGPEDGARQ